MSTLAAPKTALCKYMKAVKELQKHPDYDAEDAAQVTRWLNGDTPAAHIARTLRAAGYQVSNTRVKEHRLNDCNCSVGA